MAPNLRPTLSTRIRASFDGKGSKSTAQKPQETNTFVVQDTATLRDAIVQAISNDSFQSAIAAHLARLIEPSIKDALDTIQPVVETVYQHDILLRKTNRSVEDLLQRFDSAAEKEDHENATKVSKNVVGAEDIKQLLSEHSAQTGAKIEELSGTLREGHATTAQVVTDIAEIMAALSLSSKSLAFLTSTAHQASTDNFKMQEQLDELKVDISNILKDLETQGNTLVRIKEADLATAQILGDVQQSHVSHTLALNEIKAHDQSFKSASIPIFEKTHADTATAFQALTANLVALKENVKASFASETDTISTLGAKVDRVLTSVDTISGNDSGHEILSAVRKSNDFHTIHVTALEGIMDRLVTPSSSKNVPDETDSFADVKEHLSNIATTLDSHTNNLTTIRDNDKSADILTAVRASNESHIAHGADLGEIRAATKAIEQSHTSHTADVAEIKATVTVAGESHTSLAKNFGDLQAAMTTANESHASHTRALETIKATNDNSAQGMASQVRNLDALSTQMGTVIATLGSQSIVHSDIRDTVHASQEAHTSHSADLGEIREIVKASGESHTTHVAALDGMKTRQEGTIEQLAAHTAYLNGVQEQVGTVINNIGEQTAMHSEIRDAVHTSNASHATHTKNLEEVIAVHNSSNTQLAKQTTTLDTLSSQLGAITKTLDHQSATHSQLLDAVQTSNASHISHAATLDKVETAHADILGGVNVSRGLLVGHKDVLTSHASLLENVRDAHLKNHSDVMDAVKQSHRLLESQAGTLQGMEDKHQEIRNSVQALGGGVHLNENGLGQLRDYVKVPAVAETSESVPAVIQESSPSDSLLNKKSILGLGMATVAGGGLLAVVGSEGLFAHGSEDAKKQAPYSEKSVGESLTDVEDVKEVKPEDSVQDLVDPTEEVKQVDSVAEVAEHVEVEKPAEPAEGTFESTVVEMPAEPTEGGFDSTQVEDPVESREEKPEPFEVVKSTEPAEVDVQVEDVKSVEPVEEGIDPEEVVKPIEQAEQEEVSAQPRDVAVDEVHEAEPISGDQLVARQDPAFDESTHELTSDHAIEKPVVEKSSLTESTVQAPIHETACEDVLKENDSLHEDPELRTDEATEEAAELVEVAPTEGVEPAVEALHDSEVLHEDEPNTERPAVEHEVSYDAKSTIEVPTIDGPDLGELSSLPQSSVEQSPHDVDQILEEPVHDSAPNHTFGVSTTDKQIHDEPDKEPTPEDEESLKESPVEEEPSQEETAPVESGLSHEVELEHDMKSAPNENPLVEATADVPAYDNENLAEDSPITKEKFLNPPLRTHVLEPADKIEHPRDDSAPGNDSTIIASAMEHTLVEPESVEKDRVIVSEPATMINATSEDFTPLTESSQEIKAPEIEHPAEEPSVKHEPAAEDTAAKQSAIYTTSAEADDSRLEDTGFEVPGGGNSNSTLEDEPGTGDPITRETDTDPAAVGGPVLKEEKKATEALLAAEAQAAKEKGLNINLLPISEPIPETKNVPEGLLAAESATELSENTHLPDVNTEEVKQKTSDAVDPVAAEADQEYDDTSTELEKVHEGEPSLEAKPIMGEHSVSREAETHSESGIDVMKDVSGIEVPKEEPVVENTAGEDQTADDLAPKSLAISDPDANPSNVTSGLADEAPLLEPVIIESAMRTRNEGIERRPSLMKRVSFKEPPEEVKSAPENDAEAGPLSARETIMEEQHSEAGPIGNELTTKEPPVEVQHKGIAPDDETVVENPYVHDTLIEGEPDKEELTVENAPIVASEPLAERNSAELEPFKHETSHSTSEGPHPESEQTPQGEPSTETEPDVNEPSLGKSDHEDSLIQSLDKDNNEVTQVEAKPIVQQDLNQLTIPHVEPLTEHEPFVNNEKGQKMSTGDKIGDSEPVAEISTAKLEERKNSEIKLKEGNELSSDHDIIQNSTPKDHHVEDSDKPDLTQHDLVSHEHTEEPQNVVMAAAEEPITEPHVALSDLPLLTNSQITRELNEKSSESSITDGLAVSDPSVHEHELDQSAVEAIEHGLVADGPNTEEPKPEAPGAAVKDLTEEKTVDEVITDKPFTTESAARISDEPAQETPVVHTPPLNGAVVEEPSEMETKHEESSATKPIGNTDKAATEHIIDAPATVSDPTRAKTIAEEPALHEHTVEDMVENPIAVSTAVDESVVHESTKEMAVETEASMEPMKEHPLTEKPPGELNTSPEVPTTEKTPTEEPYGTEPLQETHPTIADTPTNAYPTEKDVDQSREARIDNQDESTVKGSTFDEHVLEKENVTEGEPPDDGVTLGGKTDTDESTANESANEVKSTAEEADLKAKQNTKSAVEDIKLAGVTEPSSVKSGIPIRPSGEIGTQVEEPTKEVERAQGVIQSMEPQTNSERKPSKEVAQAPELEATEKDMTKEQAAVHNPVDLEAPAVGPSITNSILHENASNEPTDRISMEEPTSLPPLNIQPMRVDSGIDVETPADIKSASKVESLETMVEDPVSEDTVKGKSGPDIATKEPVAENSSVEKSVLENEPQKNEPIADESTTEGLNVEAELVAGEARKEIQDTVDEPVEEDQFFNAVDEPGSKEVLTATIEPSTKTEFAANGANGNPVEKDPLIEPVPETHGEKELQINTKHNMKEQHARVDSGIDIETPMKEPLGKLQSVVEVKPALDTEQGLEDEMM